MTEKNTNKQIKISIESPLIIGGMEIRFSVPGLVLNGDKNLIIRCEKPELGEAIVRAILGLEKLLKGTININMGRNGPLIDRRRFAGFSKEDIRVAYVSVDGSDYCRDQNGYHRRK